MVYGWAGRILRVNLTTGKVSKTPSAEYTRLLMGARGTNAKLMYDESKPGQSAFDPENPVIIGAGALAGTGALGASKLEVTSRSPEQLSQGFANVGFGGSFAPELKFAGYDNIVIKGRAKRPVYLHVDNDDVELRDAAGVWGRGIFETNRVIREELGDPEVRILAIGPAGERLVRSATIEHEYRSGTALGACLGAKNLKAVVVRGTKGVDVYDPEGILSANERQLELIREAQEARRRLAREHGQAVTSLPAFGAEAVTAWFEKMDIGVVGNFEGFEWPEIDKTRGEPFVEEYRAARMGCFGCPVSCMTIIRVPGVGTSMMRCYPFWWTWQLWLTDLKRTFEATMLCSDYGLDNKHLAQQVAWLMQLYHEGVITEKETDGIAMERGSAEALISTIHKVARREGFGDILAEGALAFAKKLGGEAEKYLIHRQGVLPRTVDMRVVVGTALGVAVAARGSSHRNQIWDVLWERYMRSIGHEREIKEAYAAAKKHYGTEKAIIPWEYEGKPKLLIEAEHGHAISDMLGLCESVLSRGIGEPSEHLGRPPPPHTIELAWLNAATGMSFDEGQLLLAAERIINLERAFNVRDGWTRKDDVIPERFFEEPVPNGPRKGLVIDRAKFEQMKDEYYELRGWDVETGVPTRETLVRLGLTDVAESLDKLGRLPKPRGA